ncbi:hypothetical protein BS50DRAFT_211809 [Corynespora cassiicola Philippines]|uniref:Uncharacterized protein n=1 Tax=Corynespora cassiicola Philippines TaxID=1448308 RepID=A0A2T2N4B2_CORCC|nr:hypothetical protein BS50DRAFT_211809 [Corynespora cassiicola Philippines]
MPSGRATGLSRGLLFGVENVRSAFKSNRIGRGQTRVLSSSSCPCWSLVACDAVDSTTCNARSGAMAARRLKHAGAVCRSSATKKDECAVPRSQSGGQACLTRPLSHRPLLSPNPHLCAHPTHCHGPRQLHPSYHLFSTMRPTVSLPIGHIVLLSPKLSSPLPARTP